MTDTIDINEFSAMFAGIGDQVSAMDYSEVLKETADDFRTIHEGYFDRSAGPDGSKWAEWYFRAKNAPADHKTLVVTGRLKQSLISGPDHIENVESRGLLFGTSVPYSFQNNEGGTFPVDEVLIGRRGGMKRPGDTITLPKREHVGITDTDVDKIANRVADATVEKLKQ